MNKKAIPPEVLEFFRKQGERGGKLSAQARMEKLSPEQRSAIAKKASAAASAVRSKKAADKRRAGKPRKKA